MSTQSRTDKSHDITYPATADARGSTRINHQRRPYYLGPFESPQSYIMFGLWKHRLMETGEPPETKDLRPLVDRLLGEEPATSETFSTAIRKLTSLNFLAACACLSVAIMTTANIFLSLAPAKVDGQAIVGGRIGSHSPKEKHWPGPCSVRSRDKPGRSRSHCTTNENWGKGC